MLALQHWYTSAAFQGFIAIILALLTLIATIVALWGQFISSRRWISYEVRTAIPLIRAPAEVSKDLKVVHDGMIVENPYLVELRLVNESRRDISSTDFDQGMPIRFDFGIDIIKLLPTKLEPDEPRAIKARMDGTAVEIGPGLFHGHQALNMTLLADGSDISLRYSEPLAGVKIRKLARDNSATLGGAKLSTMAIWFAVAFLVWWIVSNPANAAQLAHNIGAFFSSI